MYTLINSLVRLGFRVSTAGLLFATLLAMLVSIIAHAQWVEKNNGIFGARIESVASNGNVLVTVGYAGAMFQSKDKGLSWKKVSISFAAKAVVASGEKFFATTWIGQVYQSGDNGDTWQPFISASSIAVCDELLFAGSQRSIDNGNTWLPNVVRADGLVADEWRSVARNDNALYAATNLGLFRSVDNGDSWIRIFGTAYIQQYRNGLSGFVEVPIIYSVTTKDDRIFLSTNDGVFYSKDQGITWAASGQITAGYYPTSIAVYGEHLIAGAKALYRSTDSGDSWVELYSFQDISKVLVVNEKLYVGGLEGLSVSQDSGDSWQQIINTEGALNIRSLAATRDTLFAATADGLYLSPDNGGIWERVKNEIATKGIFAMTTANSYLFVGTDDGLFRSSDNGKTWSILDKGLKNARAELLVRNGGDLFVGAGGSLFRSSDNGDSWREVFSQNVSLFALTESNDNLFLAGAGRLYRSEDNGITWTQISDGLTITFLSLAASSSDLYAGTNDGVYHSVDKGQTWTQIFDLNLSYGTQVGLMAMHENNLFAGVPGYGVFQSMDGGKSWHCFFRNSYELIPFHVNSLLIKEGALFAATDGGVWSYSLADFETLPLPSFVKFSPNSGPPGTSITIEGTNFSQTAEYNKVTFNGTSASVTASTNTTITTTVPEDAKTGSISVLVYDLLGISALRSPDSFTVSEITGVLGEAGNDVKVYPNPSTGYIKLDFGESSTDRIGSITDYLGRLVFSQTLGGNHAVIDAREFAPGVYFLAIWEDGRKRKTMKISIAR